MTTPKQNTTITIHCEELYLYVWQLPAGTRIYIEMSDGSCYCTLGRVDGMYRNATTEFGARALLYAYAPVEQAPEGYWRVAL